MGFPYPHHDAEFLAGVAVIALLAAAAIPASRWLPPWAGTVVMAALLALLLGWCGWTWYRVRRG